MLVATGAPRSMSGWIAQPKLDGWRAQVLVSAAGVIVWSRNGHRLDLLELGHLAALCGSRAVVLDGELVVMVDAVSDFAAVCDRMRRGPVGSPHRLGFVAFDVLAIDGRTLTSERWDVRRMILDELQLRTRSVGTMPVFEDVEAAWHTANADGWEGVVYKRMASHWRPGERSSDWRKRKVWQHSDFQITSFRQADGHLDAIGIARHSNGHVERSPPPNHSAPRHRQRSCAICRTAPSAPPPQSDGYRSHRYCGPPSGIVSGRLVTFASRTSSPCAQADWASPR